MVSSKDKKRHASPALKRSYRNFKIFYHNTYGRAGFIILVAFAVIALITPFVVHHPSYFYEAPEEDTHVASLLSSTSLSNITNLSGNGSLYSPMATDVINEGTAAIYFGTSSGRIYYYGLGDFGTNTPLGSYGSIYNYTGAPGVKMYQPLMIPLINCAQESLGVSSITLVQRFIIMPFNDGIIQVGKVGFVDFGLKTPKYYPLFNITYNGTLLGNVASNSLPFPSTITDSIPSFNYQDLGFNAPGILYFMIKNTTGNYVYEYQISPLSLLKVIKINVNDPVGLQIYGNDFGPGIYSNDSRILVYNKTVVNGYLPSGTLIFSTNVPGIDTNIGLNIPCAYDITYAHNNSAFLISGNNTLEKLFLDNGTLQKMESLPSSIYGLSTTPGYTGFPSHIILTDSNQAYIVTRNSSKALSVATVSLPPNSGVFNTQGTYDPVSDSLILVSQDGSVLSFSLYSSSGQTFCWSAGLTPVPTHTSNVVYFTDAQTGIGEVAVISDQNYFYIYNSTAKGYTPTPPMSKTPSGDQFVLGTTSSGQDGWAEFMESFWTDWVCGLSIGLVTIVLSVAVALYVGYKGGIIGNIIEISSLALFLVPSLALLIALASIIKGNADFIDLILIVSLTGWPFAAFTLIGIVKSISARSYVEASKIFGSKTLPIIRRHVLPNIGPLLLYLLALSIGGGIGAVSGLEFLGLAPLSVATWGGMLNEVYNNYFQVVLSPQWIFPPVIALTLFIVALIFVSRGMDEVSNPRLRKR